MRPGGGAELQGETGPKGCQRRSLEGRTPREGHDAREMGRRQSNDRTMGFGRTPKVSWLWVQTADSWGVCGDQNPG